MKPSGESFVLLPVQSESNSHSLLFRSTGYRTDFLIRSKAGHAHLSAWNSPPLQVLLKLLEIPNKQISPYDPALWRTRSR